MGGASAVTDRAAKAPQASRPFNPYLVLAVAIVLPGFGYALCGAARRGFTMQMFMVALAFVTWHLAPPEATLLGRLAGGIFVYAMSLPDTYRLARLRWAAHQVAATGWSNPVAD